MRLKGSSDPVSGTQTVMRKDRAQYRRLAAESLKLAEQVPVAQRATVIEAPQGWQRLAEEQDRATVDSGFTLDLVFAHGLCEGYLRGLNRAIAAPVRIAAFA